MQWDKDKSVKLSKICILFFAALMIFLLIFANKIFSLLISRRYFYLAGKLDSFLISAYSLSVPASAALLGLWRLLKNIEEGKVFIKENVKIMRLLSWRCFLAGGICVISSFYYLTFSVIAAAAVFVGILLRVVKNVFARAVDIKEENDYTI